MPETPEKLVEYLLKKSRLLKNKYSTSYRTIQSSLTNQSLELASQSELNLNLPKQKNIFKVCQWCFCYWTKEMYSFKIEPQKRPSKFMRSLLNKDVETLNEMQLKQRDKYAERRNKMVLKCHVCNKETKISLKKPDLMTMKANSNEQNSLPIKPKKKKKKKDAYAGLKSEAILKFKTPTFLDLSTTCGPENTNSSKTSSNIMTPNIMNSICNIQNKPTKKKKKKLNIEKLKIIFEKEKEKNILAKEKEKNILAKEKKKKSNAATVSNKKNSNSLLSAFLTSL